jgi:hypothetical protein
MIVGTALFTFLVVGIGAWLEKVFKDKKASS